MKYDPVVKKNHEICRKMSWKSIILRRCLKLAEETSCAPPHMIQACIDVNSSKCRYSVTSRKETKAGWHCYEEGQNVGRRTRESRKSKESQLFSSYNSATGFFFPRVWWISACSGTDRESVNQCSPWLQNAVLTVEKAAETHRLQLGKCLSGS